MNPYHQKSGQYSKPLAKVTPLSVKRLSVAGGNSATVPWTNEAIVSGIIQRSPQAAQALCDKYHAQILGRVRRLLGPESDWEDVVQQIFLSLIKNAERIREPALLDRWLGRTTINAVRKEFRKRKRQRFVIAVSEVPEVPAAIDDGALMFRRTAAVLETMHPDERTAFTLRFVAEEEIGHIADMCSWSLSTTKRRIRKARNSFLKRAGRDPLLRTIMEGLLNE